MDNYRFYSFVAGLYLSPLQCGLQTGHAISEVYATHNGFSALSKRMEMFDIWSKVDKTIIICNAMNSKGVVDVHNLLQPFASMYELPLALFHEDEQSLNGAPTACGIVLPKKYYDVELTAPNPRDYGFGAALPPRKYRHSVMEQDGSITIVEFVEGVQPEFALINLIKSYRLV